MTRGIPLVAVVVILVWPVRVALMRARWTERTPRAAIALWQAVGFAVCVALLGACFELASSIAPGPNRRVNVTDFTASLVEAHPAHSPNPNDVFGLTVGLIVATLLIGGFVVRAVGTSRARARQRLLIDLVATERSDVPGAFVIEHPRAAAFSVPGQRARVVVSSGAIDALNDEELAAVLAHEHAHLRARHDLVLLPFRTLTSTLPRSRSVAAVNDRVAALVEMAADDRALRECEPCTLAHALCTLSIADNPFVKRDVATSPTLHRIERTLAGPRRARAAAWGSACSTLGVLALPVVALFAPIVR